MDGAWYRCCKGTVRKLVDCGAEATRSSSGRASPTGGSRTFAPPSGQRVLLDGTELCSTTPTVRGDAGDERGKHPHRQGYPKGKRPATFVQPRAGVTVTLTSTAFDGTAAYVTRLRHRGARTDSSNLRITPQARADNSGASSSAPAAT